MSAEYDSLLSSAAMMNNTNFTSLMYEDEGDVTLDCPQYTHYQMKIMEFFTFWIEGVLNCAIAGGGLIANAVSAYILSREDMRNSFNFLLIALICMDSCYLVGSICEALRKNNLATQLHILLFPYFLYPFLSIAMTGSVFMTVGIALERYIAVHYPIDYSQAINSPEACKRRLFKYVAPVVVFAVAINLPKFFESEVYDIVMDMHNATANSTQEEAYNLTFKAIKVTDLRENPHYTIYYNNWTRLIVIGIAPMVLLIYFNYKIYQDVKNRNRRQMSMSRHSATATQQARRKQEDNLAVVFMGIVLVFIVCHSPRIILSLHEMVVIREAMACKEANMHTFPVWALLTMCISHVVMVINSATNMILYIFLNESFRRHFVEMVKDVGRIGMCCKTQRWNNNQSAENNGNLAGSSSTMATVRGTAANNNHTHRHHHHLEDAMETTRLEDTHV